MRVRARSRAILAHGDAYFEHWQENLARMKDPRVRELAGKHRQELPQHFANIKRLAEKTGDTFKPFLANQGATWRVISSTGPTLRRFFGG